MSQIKISNSWLPYLKDEFEKDYMKNLKQFLVAEYAENKTPFFEFENSSMKDEKFAFVGIPINQKSSTSEISVNVMYGESSTINFNVYIS